MKKTFVTSFNTHRDQIFENHISFCSQVDLGTLAVIKSLATQGRHDAAQWVSSFVLSHSSVAGNFHFYAKVSNRLAEKGVRGGRESYAILINERL